jgi:hypothetical protein
MNKFFLFVIIGRVLTKMTFVSESLTVLQNMSSQRVEGILFEGSIRRAAMEDLKIVKESEDDVVLETYKCESFIFAVWTDFFHSSTQQTNIRSHLSLSFASFLYFLDTVQT